MLRLKADCDKIIEKAARGPVDLADSEVRGGGISRRKAQHVEICLREDVAATGVTTGFERYRFRHNALPQVDFDRIETDTEFLGRRMQVPFLISSMTGGAPGSLPINRRLAAAAQRRGWAMALGSGRAVLEDNGLLATYEVRSLAPDVPVIANLGAVQLNYGRGPDDCRRLVDMLQADALVLHLNGLQEVFQEGGNRDFSGLLGRIEQVCRALSQPVGVKEVGWGIDGDVARSLADAGVRFVDVAGAGGTSWVKVELRRRADSGRGREGEAFSGWGTPTADCVREVRLAVPQLPVIASGGLADGVDAAKAIALGADLAGYGRALLASAADSDEGLDAELARVEFELRAAMFGIGAGSLAELRTTRRLVAERDSRMEAQS